MICPSAQEVNGNCFDRPCKVNNTVVGPLGTVMKGTLSLGQLKKGKGAAPTVSLTYTVAPPKATVNSNEDKPHEEEKSIDEKLKESVRAAKIKVLEVC